MSDEEERKFRCTKCGRIGSVGRCCGRDTRVAIEMQADVEGLNSTTTNEGHTELRAALEMCDRAIMHKEPLRRQG